MKKISRIIAFVVIYIFLLWINGVDWVQREWNGISFMMLMYQISTPLQGTSHEFIRKFAIKCIGKSFVESIFLVVLYWVSFKILERLTIKWEIRFFDLYKIFKLKYNKKLNVFVILAIFTMLGVVSYKAGKTIGVDTYLAQIKNPSRLYENYYVEPTEVTISFPERKRNLILIYLESMESTYFSKELGGGKEENYIPNLSRFAQENVSFSDTNLLGGLYSYVGSGWTIASILVSSTGISNLVPIQDNTVGDYEAIVPGATSLGEVLKENGYKNYFMCGSDAAFGGRKLFFEQHGDYTIYDYNTAISERLVPENYYEFWGIEDRKLYQYAKQKLSNISKKQPFNFTLLTVDTHHMNGYVCPLCQETYETQYGNVISCADRQITEFIDWIQKQDWYVNTTIVLIGDHNSMNNNFWDDLPSDYQRRTYNCFINVEKQPINMKNRTAYAMDLFPTILSSLSVQIEGNRLGLGTDLFSETQTLAEEIGEERFEQETMQYSAFFNQHFILKK